MVINNLLFVITDRIMKTARPDEIQDIALDITAET